MIIYCLKQVQILAREKLHFKRKYEESNRSLMLSIEQEMKYKNQAEKFKKQCKDLEMQIKQRPTSVVRTCSATQTETLLTEGDKNKGSEQQQCPTASLKRPAAEESLQNKNFKPRKFIKTSKPFVFVETTPILQRSKT